MKIYYAHSMLIYGTDQEQHELDAIRARYPFSRVVHPVIDLPPLPPAESLDSYLAIVRNCDIVIYSEFEGFIGKGVAGEIWTAFFNNKSVQRIALVPENPKQHNRPAVMFQRFNGHIKVYDPQDWKFKYAETPGITHGELFTMTKQDIVTGLKLRASQPLFQVDPIKTPRGSEG